jgi:hypothetical protein
MKRLGILVLGTLTAVLLAAAPASAQQAVIDDPARDAPHHTIDFTKVHVENDDSAVVAKLRLYNAAQGGTLIVSVAPRGARGVRMISEYDPVGHTTNFVVAGAFGDSHQGHQPMSCRGFRVSWSMDHPVVTLKMPSRCLNGGDYGALKFSVLTEDQDGGDADDARPTAWVPRG